MRVTDIALEDFRSYPSVDLILGRGITAFIGANGAGKTNLLEAVHLAARSDSPRAHDDTEMVRWGAATARVRVEVERSEGHRRIELLLFAPPSRAIGHRRRSSVRRKRANGKATCLCSTDRLSCDESNRAGSTRAQTRLHRGRSISHVGAPVCPSEWSALATAHVLRRATGRAWMRRDVGSTT